ncbi:unnamed protein product, partial [Ectocarpus sp. 12 AP-2014]
MHTTSRETDVLHTPAGAGGGGGGCVDVYTMMMWNKSGDGAVAVLSGCIISSPFRGRSTAAITNACDGNSTLLNAQEQPYFDVLSHNTDGKKTKRGLRALNVVASFLGTAVPFYRRSKGRLVARKVIRTQQCRCSRLPLCEKRVWVRRCSSGDGGALGARVGCQQDLSAACMCMSATCGAETKFLFVPHADVSLQKYARVQILVYA